MKNERKLQIDNQRKRLKKKYQSRSLNYNNLNRTKIKQAKNKTPPHY
jgi:hypothetical protein